jgi:hypothetical protein
MSSANLVLRKQQPARRPWTRSRKVVSILFVSLTVLAAGSTAAIASSSSVSSRARATASGSVFCQEAVIFGKGTALEALPPATVKADVAKIKALEPKFLAAAPSSIRSDLRKIFVFDNGLFADLSKVGWSFAKLPVSVRKTLALEGPKLKPESDKVIAYLDKACGLKIPKP